MTSLRNKLERIASSDSMKSTDSKTSKKSDVNSYIGDKTMPTLKPINGIRAMLQDGAVWKAEGGSKARLSPRKIPMEPVPSTSPMRISPIPGEPVPSTSKSSIVEVHADFNDGDIDNRSEESNFDIRI